MSLDNNISFKGWLKNSQYKNKDPLFVFELDCSDSNIGTLEGIEIFQNLKYLKCDNNWINSLKEIENLTKLKTLDCSRNLIDSLKHIEKLSELVQLNINSNFVTDDDIEFLPENLKRISYTDNFISIYLGEDKTLNEIKMDIKLRKRENTLKEIL